MHDIAALEDTLYTKKFVELLQKSFDADKGRGGFDNNYTLPEFIKITLDKLTEDKMLDFKEIKDGTQFEIFVRELLIAYGLRAYWSGVGPDDGKDLLCIEPQKSFFEDSEKKWLVSCKHYAGSNNSVGINDLGEVTDLCEQHGATGYILICST